MHAHPDPRRLLAALAAAFALTLAALALPAATADLDLRLGGSGSQGGPDTAPAVTRPAPAAPRWVTDPLSAPTLTIR